MFDFFSLFITVFTTVYGFYMKHFLKKPKQLLSYDKKSNKIYVHGKIGYNDSCFPIDHFSVDGSYIIYVNEIPLKTYLDGVIDGTDSNCTYFLHRNNLLCEEDKCEITIEDVLIGNTNSFTFNKGDVIDFVKLVSDL